jgi:hypothetical protein
MIFDKYVSLSGFVNVYILLNMAQKEKPQEEFTLMWNIDGKKIPMKTRVIKCGTGKRKAEMKQSEITSSDPIDAETK